MSRIRRIVAIPVSAVVVLTGGAVAAAGPAGAPSAEPVQASVVFDHVIGRVRFCEGADGLSYAEQVVTATGTVTGDPRLAGHLTLRQRGFGNDNGDGYDSGSVQIAGAYGRLKARGRFTEAGVDEISQGILVGHTRGGAGAAAMRLVAGMRLTFLDNGAVVGQFGGELPDTRLPAVVSTGRCTGPFEEFERDIPAPAADPAGGRTPRSGWLRFAG